MKTILSFFLPLLGCVASGRPADEKTIDVDGRKRVYHLHVPPGAAKPAALVLFFHGGGGTGAGAVRQTGFAGLSDKEGFLCAFPEGIGKSWNDGRDEPISEAHKEKVDDLKFVLAMIDAIAKENKIDPNRVFSTGISNGAIFSHYLAANHADRIAAIAPVVGGIAEKVHAVFKPANPVSVLIIQGTEDPLVPFKGGEITAGKSRRGRIVSTTDGAKAWVLANGCRETAVEGELPDTDPDDGCRVKTASYAAGKDGSEVVLYTVVGGGHTWPGGQQYLPKSFIGRLCRDFDATTAIWEFFKAHPRR
jgi:polyhydroxybutyrate depolymerase